MTTGAAWSHPGGALWSLQVISSVQGFLSHRQDWTTDWTLCVAAFPHKDFVDGGQSNRTLLSISTHHSELYQSIVKPLYLFACGQKPIAPGCLSAAWSALSLSELELVPQEYTWKLRKLMMVAQFHPGPIPEAVPCCGYSPLLFYSLVLRQGTGVLFHSAQQLSR